MNVRLWRYAVGAAIVVGLAIRIASVVTRPHLAPGGDPAEYLGQANLLVDGKGWIEPLVYARTGVAAQTAKLPPLYTMLLALCSLVGFKSFFAHRIWSALLSTVAVWLGAVLGRDISGRRSVGVLTAFGVALYPNMWMSAGLGMSETISPVLVMVVLWAAYRMWRNPTPGRAALVGLSIGFAALARDELAIFAVLILLPLSIGGAGRAWRTRRRLFGAGLLASLVVVVPWVTFNMVRFSHPVLISDRFGVTLASANCDASWNGPFAGYWSMPCAEASVVGVHGDESAYDPVATKKGAEYIWHHLGGLPRVELDRLGRTFAFYRVGQQMNLDIDIESRPRVWAWVGLWSFYALAALAPFGTWMLRRRGVPLFPLVAVLVDVIVVTLITYGQTRFRATLEPVLVLLAAVALERAVRGLWRRPGGFSVGARRRGSAGSRGLSGPRSGEPSAAAPPSASVV